MAFRLPVRATTFGDPPRGMYDEVRRAQSPERKFTSPSAPKVQPRSVALGDSSGALGPRTGAKVNEGLLESGLPTSSGCVSSVSV